MTSLLFWHFTVILLCFGTFIHSVLDSRNDKSKNIRPNIILLLTDDQDSLLGSMEFMPKTRRLLAKRGTEFQNAFVSTPICCPSRSSILSGLYAHNHQVMTNNQNCSGTKWREENENATFGAHLHRAGYRTGYFGKYLNEYDGTWIPPGWDEWMVMVRNSKYYNYSMNRNGQIQWHGSDYHKDYFTDLVANESIRFIRHSIIDGISSSSSAHHQPFLAVLSFPAPHGPEDPAPQFAHLFDGVINHRTDAWNHAPNPDKQWLLQRTGKMQPAHIAFTDQMQRRRLQTLQSVDEAVERLVHCLRALDQLQHTYLLFTSDHGFHLGQFGLIKGKAMPYEFDIRVPFLLRGPGVPKGKTVHSIVANIDVAPTILAMAGLKVPAQMDGTSILQLFEKFPENAGKQFVRETLLIERGKMPTLKRVGKRLKQQRERLSKERRIARECAKPKYRTECPHQPSQQQWYCVLNEKTGRWRIHKCRRGNGAHKKRKAKCQCAAQGGRKQRDLVQNGAKNADDNFDVMDEQNNADEEEEEFLRELDQSEVLESGQWFQGVFQIEDAEDGEWSNGMKRKREAIEIEREEKIISEQFDADNVVDIEAEQLAILKEACATQMQIRFCQRYFPNGTSTPSLKAGVRKQWQAHQAARMDHKIAMLDRKLSAFKNIRRALSKTMDRSSNSSTSMTTTARKILSPIASSPNCKCSNSERKERKKLGIRRRNGGGRHHQRHPLLGKTLAADLNRAQQNEGTEESLACHLDQMNCFHHSVQHWRTPPFWLPDLGQFCFCQNSNNNSYWCLRTLNSTHNFLYCEFVTEELSFYDLNKDPNQLVNCVHELSESVLEQLSAQLRLLKSCRGRAQCKHFESAQWHHQLSMSNHSAENTKNDE